MAFVSKDMKAKLAPAMKAVAKKYGFKVSVSIENHQVLVAKIKNASEIIADDSSVAADRLIGEWGYDVNQYHIESHFKKYAKFLAELHCAMMGPEWFDHSDSMVDYFYCSHYNRISLFPNK